MSGLSEVTSVLHETWAYIGQFDIIMLSETQTPATLHQQLPDHIVHTIPASTVSRRGEGLLLAVRQQLPFSITHCDADQANCVIWLTLRPSHTNQHATTIGVCYVPPETTLASQPDGRSAQLRFQALTERLLVATAQGHAVLAGDFNARVGSLPDPWVADVGDSIPPQVQNTDSTINAHGRKLVRLCLDSAMVLCTGRTLADTPAQPTFKARTNTVASRLDHVLVDPDLFSSIQYCGVGLTRPDSDHMPLEMRILLSAAAPPSPPLPPVQQHTPTWLWDGAKREQYALALQAGPCQASLQQSCGAAAAGNLQQADVHFNTALKTAARMAGLRQTRPQSSQPPRLSDFPWFDSRCAVLRSQLRRAKLLSPRSPEVRLLQRRYRGQLRRSKAAGNQRDVLSLSQLLKSNPRQFWRKASLPHSVLPPELQTPSAWDGYLANLTAPPVHIADQLPLPHTPQPPAPAASLDQPLTQAEIEVALQRLHNGRSGALLGYTSELLRYAKLSATDEDPAPEHLLVPCLQLLFNTAFSTGSVPQSWKTSLVTPIFKQGDATNTANYRPIAVGEPLSRLYASILVQRLVQFTEQHDLRSPTQAGYRPEHSTIHQAFVLQHVIDKHRCLRTPLYLCFVDLKSAYDRVQWPLLWDLLRRLGVHGKMLGAVQSLYDNCLLFMRVSGYTGESRTPSMGLRQGCPLSATLFGLFVDGLHHYLETMAPAAGIQIQHLRLRELVYADDICLMASSPEHLQALIDALSSYCAVLHMEISVLKTKVMVVSPVPAPAVAFLCNGNPIEQVTSFKYLGLHFHQSGAVAHLVTPIKSKAGGAWAAVQRRHSLLQCGKTINLHLHLLQAVLVSVLLYGCQVWGMHSPRVAAANRARLDLQRLYDYYLRTICGLLPSTPRRMLLVELGLLPLQVLWWRQTLRFWNGLAALPVGSFYHTVCLDNLTDAFQGGACNMASSVASCLGSVGYDMPRVFDVIPLLEIDSIVEALTVQLQDMGSAALYCPRKAPTRGVVSCTYEQWFRPYSLRRRYCHLPVSGRGMQRFLQFRLGCHGLPVAAGRLAGAAHVGRAHRVCLACNGGAVGDEMHLIFECTALASLRSRYASLFTDTAGTMRSFFAQPDHIGVFHYVVDCLDFMMI